MKITSFDLVASDYTTRVSPSRFSQFLALIHEIGINGSERVLDIGAGPGILSLEIARRLDRGGSLLGIDLAPNMVHLARTNAANSNFTNTAFEIGDALGLQFEDNSFDVIVSSNAFPWVPDRKKFLSEVLRVLKPSGRFGLVALSDKCYNEFSSTISNIGREHPDLFPRMEPFAMMGAKLHSLTELDHVVRGAGFDIQRNFVLSTEEKITPGDYLQRINAIVNENYLDHLDSDGKREKVRNLIFQSLLARNGSLNITESSVFVIARKQAA
ncbi:MAG: class I SAM-dependent methyltransferase [bacterium]|nr:class I SAM-dependent methyltransferase [bacterium]